MVRAQQGERMRRIGVLMDATADDEESQARVAAFRQGLQSLGWTDDRNVGIDIRWSVWKIARIYSGSCNDLGERTQA